MSKVGEYNQANVFDGLTKSYIADLDSLMSSTLFKDHLLDSVMSASGIRDSIVEDVDREGGIVDNEYVKICELF